VPKGALSRLFGLSPLVTGSWQLLRSWKNLAHRASCIIHRTHSTATGPVSRSSSPVIGNWRLASSQTAAVPA